MSKSTSNTLQIKTRTALLVVFLSVIRHGEQIQYLGYIHGSLRVLMMIMKSFRCYRAVHVVQTLGLYRLSNYIFNSYRLGLSILILPWHISPNENTSENDIA